jgi:hypothetical protein
MSDAVWTPPELAPALRERLEALLAQVELFHREPECSPPGRPSRRRRAANRYVVCFQSGRLGGHHGRSGRIEWVHRRCHRKLHRRLKARDLRRRLSPGGAEAGSAERAFSSGRRATRSIGTHSRRTHDI